MTFTFDKLPKTLDELKSLKECDFQTPFKTAALTILALSNYNDNPDETIEMLDYLNGPNEVNNFDKQFLKEHLGGNKYLMNSYFNGSTPDNGYTPSVPYSLDIEENPYSYNEENYATLYVKSSGADSPRQIKLRKKASTNEWFLNEQFLLASIKAPKEEDPWA